MCNVYSLCVAAGKGCVYSFDPVGSYERETYRAGGSAAAMLQPLLDNQVMLGQHSHSFAILCFTIPMSISDWVQKSECGREGSPHSREGSVSDKGCVHGGCGERHLHRGWGDSSRHYSNRGG